MDMVGYSDKVFRNIKNDLIRITGKHKPGDSHYIPISAKYGDNVVEPSVNMTWYKGETFLRLIETIEIRKNLNSSHARFPIQTVIRPLSAEFHDYRGYAGRVAGGAFYKGNEVVVLPSLRKSIIKSIDAMGKCMETTSHGDSVTITLEDHIDISRGDMIVKSDGIPLSGQIITLMICWFNERPLEKGRRFIIRNNTNETSCIVTSVNYKMNISTLNKGYEDFQVCMNDIANISIRTAKPLFYDKFVENHITGSLIFIEEGTNETVGAGMIEA
jgi:sulfate adenylyltransferase subunit 1